MVDNEGSIYYLLEEMIRKGLAATSGTWIEKAVEQRNSRLAVGIAASMILAYDRMDRKLLTLIRVN
jgi:hypothetical protein